MTTITLVSFRDESSGQIGLGIESMPRDETTNAATDGALLAHDLIEHVNGPEYIGTISDEFEALGALWYTRGQHGQIFRDGSGSRYSPEQNIGFDVVRMFRDHVYGAHVNDAKRTRPCDADAAFVDVLTFAASSYLSEFDPEDEGKARDAWPAYREACLAGLRTGYRKAFNRWEKRGRYAAHSQFWAIADAVQPFTRGLEYEGARFSLTFGNGEAHCASLEDYE